MRNTQQSLTPAQHDIHVIVVSEEEASLGVAELWSGNRLVAVTCVEDGELTLRIGSSHDDVVLGTRALTAALAEANRLLALD